MWSTKGIDSDIGPEMIAKYEKELNLDAADVYNKPPERELTWVK